MCGTSPQTLSLKFHGRSGTLQHSTWPKLRQDLRTLQAQHVRWLPPIIRIGIYAYALLCIFLNILSQINELVLQRKSLYYNFKTVVKCSCKVLLINDPEKGYFPSAVRAKMSNYKHQFYSRHLCEIYRWFYIRTVFFKIEFGFIQPKCHAQYQSTHYPVT